MVAYGTIRNIDDVGSGGGVNIITAARAPTDSDGAVNDYWLDNSAHILYGPKSTGSSLFVTATDPSIIPARTSSSGTNTLGLRFQFVIGGNVTALRFYRSPQSVASTRPLLLYRNGVEVARVNTTSETGSGWKEVPLPTPVSVSPGVDYVAAYNSVGFFVDNLTTPVSSFSPSYMTVLSSCYLLSEGFPSNNNAANYFADLVFNPSSIWPVAIKSVAFF